MQSDREHQLNQLEKEMEKVLLQGKDLRGDTEALHLQADSILCKALVLCGRARLVELWTDLPKWYA